MTIRARLAAAGIMAARLTEMPSHALLYAAAGLLRIDDLRQMSNRVWRRFHTDERDMFGGLSPWEQRAFQRAIRAGDRICVVGCGTGRELLALIEAGHEVAGVEPSPEPVALLRQALRERARDAAIIEAFVEDAALPGMFDVLILSNHCYNYIPGSARRIAALRQMRNHVHPGGRVVIFYLRRYGDWGGASVKLAALTSRITGSDMRWDAHDVVERGGGDERLLLFTHFFSPEELEHEARTAGFRIDEHVLDGWSQPVAILSHEVEECGSGG